MKLVIIEWYDSCLGNTWVNREYREHIDKVVSFGVIVREDDKEIELNPNITPDHKLYQMAIPKGCIIRMRRIKIDEYINRTFRSTEEW